MANENKTPMYDSLKELYQGVNNAIRNALKQDDGDKGAEAYKTNITDSALKFMEGTGVNKEKFGSILYRSFIAPFTQWLKDFYGNPLLALREKNPGEIGQIGGALFYNIISDPYTQKTAGTEKKLKINPQLEEQGLAGAIHQSLIGDLSKNGLEGKTNGTEIAEEELAA